MNDKTRKDDFDKKLVLPNVMKKNRVHREMKLAGITRFIYLCCLLFLKLKSKTSKQTKKNYQ